MARRVRDAQLETRSSRAKLGSRLKPYYRLIEKGLHLGYRRLSGRPGTWSIRYYLGEQKYALEKIGEADDLSDADGIAILSFWQAQNKARERFAARAKVAAGVLGPLLIADIVKAYVAQRDARETLRRGRRFHSDAWRLLPYVIGREKRGGQGALPASSLATRNLQELREADLLGWQQELPGRLKPTSKRRLINDLKAALNSAFEANHRQLDPSLLTAIRRGLRMVSDEPSQVARENQILGNGQVTTILAAAYDIDAKYDWDGDLVRFVTVLAATGARFSQVARMRVMDVQREAGRLLIPTSRKGKGKGKAKAANALQLLWPLDAMFFMRYCRR